MYPKGWAWVNNCQLTQLTKQEHFENFYRAIISLLLSEENFLLKANDTIEQALIKWDHYRQYILL